MFTLFFYYTRHPHKLYHAFIGQRLSCLPCLAPEEFQSRSGPWSKKVVHHCTYELGTGDKHGHCLCKENLCVADGLFIIETSIDDLPHVNFSSRGKFPIQITTKKRITSKLSFSQQQRTKYRHNHNPSFEILVDLDFVQFLYILQCIYRHFFLHFMEQL